MKFDFETTLRFIMTASGENIPNMENIFSRKLNAYNTLNYKKN